MNETDVFNYIRDNLTISGEYTGGNSITIQLFLKKPGSKVFEKELIDTTEIRLSHMKLDWFDS